MAFNLTIQAVSDHGGAQSGQFAVFINENIPTGTLIGKLVGFDSTTINYTIQADADWGGRFGVMKVGSDYYLYAKNGGSQLFDYEDPEFGGIFDFITFKFFDGTKLLHQAIVDVKLNDIEPEGPVNQAPHTVLLNGQTALTIAENTAFDGTLSAQDDGLPNNNLTYSFDTTAAGGGNANGLFVIVNGKIQLAAGRSLNYEAGATYTIYVKASDGSLSSQTQAITITLTDVNEVPTDITYSTNNILAENAQVGDIITNAATVTDPDSAAMNGGFVFALVNAQGNPITASNFSVNTTTGQITVGPNGLPDISTRTTYDVYVKVTDKNGSGLSYVKKIVVTVDPVAPTNQPPVVNNFSGSVNTDDNAAAVQPFGTVTITDSDSTEVTVTLTFDLSKGSLSNLGGFALNTAGTAYVFKGTAAQAQAALRALQYNPNDNPTGAVGATDTTTFSLSVSDNNGNTTTPSTSINVVSTVANRAPVLTVVDTTHTADANNNTNLIKPFANNVITVSDTNANDQLTITITMDTASKGEIGGLPAGGSFAGGVFRYTGTVAQITAMLANLTYNPTDKSGTSNSSERTTFTVTLKDAGDASAPAVTQTIKVDSNYTVSNTQPSISVDSGKASHATTDSGAAALAFEGVTVSDADPNETLTVTISFAKNEGDLVFGNVPSTITKSGPADELGTRTYTLTGKAESLNIFLQNLVWFDPTDQPNATSQSIVTTQFTIGVKDPVNPRVTNTSVNVVTTVTDKDIPNAAPEIEGADTPVTKTVADIGVVKPFSAVSFSDNENDTLTVTITFDKTKGVLIDRLGDIYTSGTYTFVGDKTAATAAVQALTFNPTDRPYGAANSVETTDFTISVKDNSHSPVTNSNVHVASVKGNTAPFDLGPGNMAVQELAAKGAVVGTLAALDNNAGDAFTYTLLDNAGGRFALGADNRSIVVDNGFKLDFEQAQSHTITVQVKDREGAVFSKVLSIGVLDANPEVTIGSADNDVFKGGIGKDTLGGGFGNDILWGGNGNDTLTGNAGKDIFAFNTKLGTAKTDRKLNFDTIKDFNVKDDTFWLDNAIFKKLGKKGTEAKPAKLNKKFFTIGDKANDKDDYLVYDSKKGVLYYDADGSGSKEAVEFAKLKTKLKMTYKDFLVI